MTRRNGHPGYPDLSGIDRVLVIKLRQHGDVLIASPVFRVLRRALPEARIDAYVNRDTASMLEGHPDIDAIHVYNRSPALGRVRRLAHELALVRAVRSRRYDLVLNLTEGDRGAVMAWLSGARYRAGIDPQGKGILFKSRLYTHVVKRPRTLRHAVEQQLDALRHIGISPTEEERDLIFIVPDAARATVDQTLQRSGLRRGEFVLVHPASRGAYKCWPAHLVAGLIRQLHQAEIRVAVSSGPDPKELAFVRDVVANCSGVPLLDLSGRTTLKELGAWIQASRCLVTVDSVPLHIASALKHPVVAIFGPSYDQVWGPWRNPLGRVVTTDFQCRPCGLEGCGGSQISECLQELSVASVYEQVMGLAGIEA